MTQEEKNILMADLSARLPYGVKVWHPDYQEPQVLDTIYNYEAWNGGAIQCAIDDCSEIPHQLIKCKPYLRSSSSLDEAELEELGRLDGTASFYMLKGDFESLRRMLEHVYSKHIDLFGLIGKGLALEAPEGMYGKEEETEEQRLSRIRTVEKIRKVYNELMDKRQGRKEAEK